ncbi:glycosyltransferase [Cytophagales bacterium LB-30]|uniref:Glycosyltransferase n=1 Tax=Shiella aurantiaca TaxID=3058365 RepID=A0ABT8F1R3_9BACT|nr:glycosyltransferase [Shiella aurantiaca]MDN4164392.1 glycosyltransferase [Shiella aurantiaca]
MNSILLIFLFINGLYFLGLLALRLAYTKKEDEASADYFPTVAVVITARNESENVKTLLQSLGALDYPKERLHIYLWEDNSEENTWELFHQHTQSLPFSYTLQKVPEGVFSAKKWAIEQTTSATNAEILLLSDADCKLPSGWVKAMVAPFAHEENHMVIGPVTYFQTERLFSRLQVIEFASLVATGIASAKAGKPTMCNAANLAFRRISFLEMGGYSQWQEHVGGDDELLLYAMHEKWPGSVAVCSSAQVLVETHAASSWSEFWHQRIRWASKWNRFQRARIIALALAVFSFHAMWCLAYASVFVWPEMGWLLGLIFMLKASGEALLLYPVLKSWNRSVSMIHMILASFLYPFYAVLIGIASNFTAFNWKGKRYV